MKTKNVNQEVKSYVVSGLSSAAGSAAGVMIGSVMTQDAHATEQADTLEAENAETVAAVAEQQGASQTGSSTEEQVSLTVAEEPEDDVDVEVVDTRPDEILVTPVDDNEETSEAKPNVLSYETITTDSGQQMDVAVVDVEGVAVGLVDTDQDGIANLAMADLNGNGEADEGEIEDISEGGILMQPLQEAADEGSDNIAQVSDGDYVNDANVDLYYA